MDKRITKINHLNGEQIKAKLMELKTKGQGVLSKHAQNLLSELGTRSIDRLWVRRDLGYLGKWKGALPMAWEVPRG